ncbi:MAG: NAD(P)-dependent oxidoreductase [Ignavibacteriales bacterium]|nr:NAD(P)-dependent oxidoreductase [Ignavibacteriales bacterium]
MPTALVTGGTGFIGSHTIELLLQRGFKVRCLVRRTRSNLGWIEGSKAEIVRASYLDVDTLREAIHDAEYIFHVAGVTKAKKQSQYHQGNVVATRNLLEAATGNSTLKKFCFVSSLTAVGPSPDGTLLDEEAPCHPITAYGVSKLEAETVCELYSPRLPIVILRPPAVYGPRDRDLLEIFRWVKLGLKPVFGSDQKKLSVVYGPELARAMVEAAISPKTAGQTYFVADPAPYRLSSVLECVAAMFGKRGINVRFPSPLLYTLGGIAELGSIFSSNASVLNVEKARDLLQTDWVCSPQKLEDHIGFRTQVSLEESLRATIDWYREYGLL